MQFKDLPDSLKQEAFALLADNSRVAEWHRWLDKHGVESAVSFTMQDFEPDFRRVETSPTIH